MSLPQPQADSTLPGLPESSRARVRRSARALARRAAGWSAAAIYRVLGSCAGQRFGVLMYHRVAEPVADLPRPTFNVAPADFARQLAGLLARGYAAWPLHRLVETCQRGEQLPAGVFAVTFDDGHQSVYDHAWPILQRLNVPATIFLPTAYLDSGEPFPFDDWVAAGDRRAPRGAWQPMTLAHCRELATDELIDLGAHTHTHRRLNDRPEEFRRDLARNVELLRFHLGVENPPFAFPFGLATPEMLEIARELRLSCALTTEPRLVAAGDDPFGWGRFDVEHWDTAGTLAAKLGGWYSRMRRRGARSAAVSLTEGNA